MCFQARLTSNIARATIATTRMNWGQGAWAAQWGRCSSITRAE
jgi:hypothetical protein